MLSQSAQILNQSLQNGFNFTYAGDRRDKESRKTGEFLTQWAELVLPYLHAADLASISMCCKLLYGISKRVTVHRASDAARSLEKYPIPFLNPVDNQPYSYFIYSAFSILPSAAPMYQYWGARHPNMKGISRRDSVDLACLVGEARAGCKCGVCSRDDALYCPCLKLDGRKLDVKTECGPGCVCGPECFNRLTQNGIFLRLKTVKDREKGWGLHSDQFIREGTFICEYVGEFLTTNEARRRQCKYDQLALRYQASSALLVVREHLPSGRACLRLNIDATRVGNIARFINHSCDGGNLLASLVRSFGAVVPRLCFFAARDILEGEELCFKYGDIRINPRGRPCFCGTKACYGILPSEII